MVIETKGDQLDGNLDTKYKKKLLQTINDNFKVERVKKAGELELVFDDSTTVSCDMLLMSEWKTKVHDFLPK